MSIYILLRNQLRHSSYLHLPLYGLISITWTWTFGSLDEFNMSTVRLLLSCLLFKQVVTLSGKLFKCFLKSSARGRLRARNYAWFLIQGTSGTSRICTGTRRTKWPIILSACAHRAATAPRPTRGHSETTRAILRGSLSTPPCMPWRTFYLIRTSSCGQGT